MWSSLSDSKFENYIGRKTYCITPNKWYSRVVLSGENSEPKYSNYLCFVVSVQTNKLMSEYGGKYGRIAYTETQQQTHDLIKSLHESGLGYRRIAQHLNSKNITTLTGKEWKEIMSLQSWNDTDKGKKGYPEERKCLNQRFPSLRLGTKKYK